MTSHFDHLANLAGVAYHMENTSEVLPLVNLIFKHAVDELDLLEPKRVTFEKWLQDREWRKTEPEPVQKALYVDFCHDVLDHGERHLKCFSREFLIVTNTVNNLFDRYYYQNKENKLYVFELFDAKPKEVLKYKDIWLELIKLEGTLYVIFDKKDKLWIKMLNLVDNNNG